MATFTSKPNRKNPVVSCNDIRELAIPNSLSHINVTYDDIDILYV